MDKIIKEIAAREVNYKDEKFSDFAGLIKKLDENIDDLRSRLKSENRLLSVNQLFDENIRKGKRLVDHDVFCEMTDFTRSKTKKENKYQGVYVFCKKLQDEMYPVYLGISKNIAQRLRGHLFNTDKGTTTWFYLMARRKNGNRPYADNQSASEAIVKIRDQWIDELKVMAYPVEGNYEMALAEIYMASKLKVYWNSFETH